MGKAQHASRPCPLAAPSGALATAPGARHEAGASRWRPPSRCQVGGIALQPGRRVSGHHAVHPRRSGTGAKTRLAAALGVGPGSPAGRGGSGADAVERVVPWGICEAYAVGRGTDHLHTDEPMREERLGAAQARNGWRTMGANDVLLGERASRSLSFRPAHVQMCPQHG